MVGSDLASGIGLYAIGEVFSKAFWDIPLKAMSASDESRRKCSVLYLVKPEIRKSPNAVDIRTTPGFTDFNAPYQFISNGGYSRNTLAAVTKVCFVAVRGGSVSPASRRKASGNTS